MLTPNRNWSKCWYLVLISSKKTTHAQDRGYKLMWKYLCIEIDHKIFLWAIATHYHNVCAVLSRFSHLWLFATLWTAAHQAPLSMGLSGPEYWSGVLFPSPGDLPNPGIEPMSLTSPALAGKFFTTRATQNSLIMLELLLFCTMPWGQFVLPYLLTLTSIF